MDSLHIVLVWANLTIAVSGIFFAGVIWNQLQSLKKAIDKLGDLDVLKGKVELLISEMERMRNRVDTWLDKKEIK